MFRNIRLSSSSKTRSKYFQFVLILFTLGIVFIPNDVFALDFSSSPVYCQYNNSSTSSSCGKATLVTYPNASNNQGWTVTGKRFVDYDVAANNHIRMEQSSQSLCTSENYGGTVDFYLWFNKPYADQFLTSNFDVNGDSNFFSCTTSVVTNNYGVVYHCTFTKSFNNSVVGLNIRYKYSSGDISVTDTINVGWGQWTQDYTCATNETDIIVNNDNKNTNNIINNNNQNTDKIIAEENETQDKIDNINSTLNNSDIDGATGSGRDFFDNFTLEDNGGISAIVTLPLRVINGLISGENNCSALNFTLFDKDMYFPGGCIMWDEVSSANETLYQTIICGFFGYILLTMLFKDIEDLKNPDKEEVSTLDL